MYALFRNGERKTKGYDSLVSLWIGIVTHHPFAISGTANTLHFAVTLEKGYEIREIKENDDAE